MNRMSYLYTQGIHLDPIGNLPIIFLYHLLKPFHRVPVKLGEVTR